MTEEEKEKLLKESIHKMVKICDEAWKPIMPRGEVYSTQFTERGWKSFSEIHNGLWSNR